jgi:hypothetical protein
MIFASNHRSSEARQKLLYVPPTPISTQFARIMGFGSLAFFGNVVNRLFMGIIYHMRESREAASRAGLMLLLD